MNSELQKLIALQELDIKIKEIKEEIDNIPKQKAAIETEFNTFAADYLDKKSRLDTAKREHRQLELDLQAAESALEKYKQDLMQVRNEREYSTVLREIDATKKKISSLETEVLQKLDLIEHLEKEINVLTPEIETKRQEFDVRIDACSAKLETLNAELERLTREREDLANTIPADLLSIYNRLVQLRDGMALAEVRDGSCTACFMTVRPQVYADVRKGEQILTCDNCSRILYYKGTVEAESKSAS